MLTATFPYVYGNTFDITGIDVGNGLYMMVCQESISSTNRSNPSYAFIYINNGSTWITLQKGEGSSISSVTFSNETLTVNLSTNKYFAASTFHLL